MSVEAVDGDFLIPDCASTLSRLGVTSKPVETDHHSNNNNSNDNYNSFAAEGDAFASTALNASNAYLAGLRIRRQLMRLNATVASNDEEEDECNRNKEEEGYVPIICIDNDAEHDDQADEVSSLLFEFTMMAPLDQRNKSFSISSHNDEAKSDTTNTTTTTTPQNMRRFTCADEDEKDNDEDASTNSVCYGSCCNTSCKIMNVQSIEKKHRTLVELHAVIDNSDTTDTTTPPPQSSRRFTCADEEDNDEEEDANTNSVCCGSCCDTSGITMNAQSIEKTHRTLVELHAVIDNMRRDAAFLQESIKSMQAEADSNKNISNNQNHHNHWHSKALMEIREMLLQVMVGQTEAAHNAVHITHQIRDTQRTTQFLVSENSLLRTRQSERQRLALDLYVQHQLGQAASIRAMSAQIDGVLKQQAALIDAMRVFSVSFDLPAAAAHAPRIIREPTRDLPDDYDEIMKLLNGNRRQHQEWCASSNQNQDTDL
jgi:hypothetical protein